MAYRDFEIFLAKFILPHLSRGLASSKGMTFSVEELMGIISINPEVSVSTMPEIEKIGKLVKSPPVGTRCQYIFSRSGAKHSKGDQCENICVGKMIFCTAHMKYESSKKILRERGLLVDVIQSNIVVPTTELGLVYPNVIVPELEKTSLGKTSLGKTSLGKTSLGKTSLGKTSLEKETKEMEELFNEI